MTTCPMHPKGEQGKEPKELKLSFWISLIGTIFLVFLPTSGVLNIGIEATLTTVIVFGCGRPLINQGLKSLARRKFNMFTLIFLGIGTSYLYSLAASVYIFLLSLENILHEMPLYFEAAGAITTFTLLGQFLEKSAEKKATSALHKLFDLAPKMARLVQDNQEIDIPISQIKVGDFLRIRAGEKVPTDGTIVEGNGSINASMITGESRPVFKQTGDFVMGATINEQGSFILQARQVGSDTVLSQIIEAVQEAQKSEIPIQKLVDRVSRYFVPIVILIALCTFILWSFLSPTSTYFQALMSAISVLIIACPCALGLATPMALTIGIGQAATEGILIKNAKALEILSKATTIVFDKTGTLTEGKPRLVHQISFEAFSELEALQLAASLEQANIHPLGFAFLSKAQADNITLKPVEDFQNIEGKGISGIIEGKKTILGSKKILSDVQKNNLIHLDTFRSWQESGHTVLYLLVDGILTASFALCDPIKNEAKKVLETLHKSNKELILLTGDEPKAVQIFENEYPIDRIESGIFPIQKQTIIEQLQQAGKIVAMIGDGINDAPALAQAHVSIAMGQGSDIAIDAADIILMQGNLQLLLRAQELSLSTLSIVRQNLLFAFGYNVIAIGIAAGVLYPIFHVAMNPMLASMAMLLSSLSVTLNSLRLQKRAFALFKPIYKAKAATLGGLILLGSHFYQDWQRHSMPLEPIEKSVQRILPSGESLLKIAPLKGGFANYIWDIHTENNHYILREKRKKVSPCSFMRDLKISQKAFQYHMGPQVLGANTSRQQILLEYIDHSSWPFYKKNFEPYQAAMKLLRSFHDQMPIHTHIDENTIYAPFYSIFNMRDTLLETSAEIPSHFFIAAKKMEEVFDKIRPWLQKHARLCHGDFCKANVLLSKKLTPTLIDFDSAFLGDPFFDIIKFSAALPQEKRLELFKSYLGDKEPTLEQLCHFKLMDLTFLMVIATLRFQSAQASDCLNEKLSKNSMEDILNREENLPSWSEVPFGNNSPLMKQTAALYALAEFLKRIPELESLISTFFSSEDSAYQGE